MVNDLHGVGRVWVRCMASASVPFFFFSYLRGKQEEYPDDDIGVNKVTFMGSHGI